MIRVKGKRAVVTALAALTVGVSGVAVAGIAQAATSTCDGRVMEAGLVEKTLAQDVYGEAAVPVRGASDACRLARGDFTGTDPAASPVYWLQLTLNECYGAGLALDGDYGGGTRAALIAVQRDAGIERDGVYGPETRDHMRFFTHHTERNGVVRSACVAYGSLL
jgi:peptidoglycan hydrolase-like protein with peptidoglycan-binding domain